MASLVSPSFAITPDHLVNSDPNTTWVLWFPPPVQRNVTGVTVMQSDHEIHFSILQLPAALDFPEPRQLPKGFLSTEEPAQGDKWECVYFKPGISPGARLSGTVGFAIPKLRAIELILSGPAPNRADINGAPVVINGKLSGIVTNISGQNSILAIPTSEMAKSSVINMVAHIKWVDANRPTKTLQPVSGPVLFQRLSFSSREAIGRAFSLSIELAQAARRTAATVHMEHLLVGLYDKQGGPTAQLFARAGLDRSGLLQCIYKAVETSVPDHYPAMALAELPPLSKHVREALMNAAKLADEKNAAIIHSRYLLHGALSLESCSLIQELRRFSPLIVPANVDLDAPPSKPQIPAQDSATDAGESIEISSISDAPAEKDTLGFEPYVQAISRFLLSPDTKPPLTLSIEGEWGSGKSSLMLQLKRAVVGEPLWRRLKGAWQETGDLPPRSSRLARLRQAIRQRQQFFVQFNPWRHDKEEALWAAFALEFMRQLSRERFLLRRWWADLRLFFAHYHWKSGWFEALRAVFTWAVILVLLIVVPAEILINKPRWAEQMVIALSEQLGAKQNQNASPGTGAGPQPTPAVPNASTVSTSPKAKDSSSGAKGEQKRETKTQLDPILKALLLIGGNAAYFAVVLSIWLKAKDLIGNPLQVGLKKYLRTPDYEGRVAFVEQFHHDFKKIVDAYAGREKVFVFIDDLDRCEIPKAADLVKAVNLLIADDPRLVFVLGMDREKVAAGLAVKYEDLLPYLAPSKLDQSNVAEWKQRSGLEYGQAFLEKFIQLPFHVPDPNLESYADFINTISVPIRAVHQSAGSGQPGAAPDSTQPAIADVKSQPPAAPAPKLAGAPAGVTLVPPDAPTVQLRRERELRFQGDSDAVRAVALMIARTVGPNPRRLKQFINLFRLQAYIANEIGLFDQGPREQEPITPITLQQLGKFVGISLKWPALLEDWRLHPSLLAELQRFAVEKDPAPDAAAPEVAKWLREGKLQLLLRYGISDDDLYTLTNPSLYKLLHVCPQRTRASSAVQADTRKPLPAATEP